jgi:tetratricopeptide (TPR) repeat protein
MSDRDWFRQTDWNEEIERLFFKKLRAARSYSRAQYLQIQSGTLIQPDRPDLVPIAIGMAQRVLAEYPDELHQVVLAHGNIGRAHEMMGEIDQAIAAYRNAWKAEDAAVGIRTNARLKIALLLVMNDRKDDADEAFRAIDDDGSASLFPVVGMTVSLVRATIRAWRGDPEGAAQHAEDGLRAAAQERSPLRYHAQLGLVNEKHAKYVAALKKLTRSAG